MPIYYFGHRNTYAHAKETFKLCDAKIAEEHKQEETSKILVVQGDRKEGSSILGLYLNIENLGLYLWIANIEA